MVSVQSEPSYHRGIRTAPITRGSLKIWASATVRGDLAASFRETGEHLTRPTPDLTMPKPDREAETTRSDKEERSRGAYGRSDIGLRLGFSVGSFLEALFMD